MIFKFFIIFVFAEDKSPEDFFWFTDLRFRGTHNSGSRDLISFSASPSIISTIDSPAPPFALLFTITFPDGASL